MVDRRGFLLPLAPVMVLYDFGGSRLCRWFVIWDRTAKFVCHGHAYGYVTTVDQGNVEAAVAQYVGSCQGSFL